MHSLEDSPDDAPAQEILRAAATLDPETCEDALTMQDCHNGYPAGCSENEIPKYDPLLNYLKNRMPAPASVPKGLLDKKAMDDLESKIPITIRKDGQAAHIRNLLNLGEGQIRYLIGYLYYAKKSGKETCNCQLTTKDAVDFQLGVGFEAFPAGTNVREQLRNGTPVGKIQPDERETLQQKSIVVKITPHYRERHHRDWNLSKFQRATGRQVKVVGQLLVDSEHALPYQNCGHPDRILSTCWRASAWEIHPVIEFYLCVSNHPCTPDSTNWKPIGDLP